VNYLRRLGLNDFTLVIFKSVSQKLKIFIQYTLRIGFAVSFSGRWFVCNVKTDVFQEIYEFSVFWEGFQRLRGWSLGVISLGGLVRIVGMDHTIIIYRVICNRILHVMLTYNKWLRRISVVSLYRLYHILRCLVFVLYVNWLSVSNSCRCWTIRNLPLLKTISLSRYLWIMWLFNNYSRSGG